MSRVACIANPNARDGKLAKNFHKIDEALTSSGLEYDVFMTEGTGHAIEIASGLRDSDYDLIVAIGGDGTVHESRMASEAHRRGSGLFRWVMGTTSPER